MKEPTVSAGSFVATTRRGVSSPPRWWRDRDYPLHTTSFRCRDPSSRPTPAQWQLSSQSPGRHEGRRRAAGCGARRPDPALLELQDGALQVEVTLGWRTGRYVDRDLGLHTVGSHRVVVGGEPAGDGDPHAPVIRQLGPDLDCVLPVGVLPDQRRAPSFQEGCRKDLRGRCTPTVDKYYQWQRWVGRQATGRRLPALDLPARRLLGEDEARPDELRGDPVGGVDVSARVIPKVEDDRGGPIVQQLLQPGVELVGARRAEAVQRDVADLALEHLGVHLAAGDLAAGDLHVEGATPP